MNGEFNIDLEDVGAASKGQQSDASDDEGQDGPKAGQALDMEQSQEEAGLIVDGPGDATLPKSYPRLL